jgi:hypothetical protein
MRHNVFGLGEGGDFHHLGSTEIDAENQTLINHLGSAETEH